MDKHTILQVARQTVWRHVEAIKSANSRILKAVGDDEE